jgi:hypothetical protein
MAKVMITLPSGYSFETLAAVANTKKVNYPYLLSNSTWNKIKHEVNPLDIPIVATLGNPVEPNSVNVREEKLLSANQLSTQGCEPGSPENSEKVESETKIEVFEDQFKKVISPDLSCQETQELKELIEEFSDIFASTIGNVTTGPPFDIELSSDTEFKYRAFRLSQKDIRIEKQEIDKMMREGIIEKGYSPYVSPSFVLHSGDKEPRYVVDYRELNKLTRKNVWPIPNTEERIEKIAAASFITSLDLIRAYWQVPLTKRAKQYAAFATSSGIYRPNVMMFGLKNAPFHFQRLMNDVLAGFEEFANTYLDDIAIFEKTWELHIQDIRKVFSRLRVAKFKLKLSKCRWLQGNTIFGTHDWTGQKTPGGDKSKGHSRYTIS